MSTSPRRSFGQGPGKAGTPFRLTESARKKVPGGATGTERTAVVPDITPQVPQVTTSTSSGVSFSPSRIRLFNSAAVRTTALPSLTRSSIPAMVFI